MTTAAEMKVRDKSVRNAQATHNTEKIMGSTRIILTEIKIKTRLSSICPQNILQFFGCILS